MKFEDEWRPYYKEVPNGLYKEYLSNLTVWLLQQPTKLKIMIDHLNEISESSEANFRDIDDMFDVFTKAVSNTHSNQISDLVMMKN